MKLWSALKRRKYRQEHEALTSQDDEADGETPAIESNCMRPKAIPLDLSLPAGFESDSDELLMRGTPQDTLSSTPASNGRQSPVSRLSQVNGQHSPSARPAALPNTPKGGDKSLNSSLNKKKGSNWFSLSYKQKSEEFHKLFKDIPADERLLVDYSCAMQKDILVHGRLYISQNWICFYANILFKWETTVMIPCKQIKSITKEKTARVIPNAIQINTGSDKYFFSSFGSRDKTYLMMFRVWQNFLLEKPLSNQQLWQWVHRLYGSQLGLTASDDDYQSPDCTHDSDNATTAEISSVAGSDVTVERARLVSPASGTFTPTEEVDGQVEPNQQSLPSGTDSSETEDACEEGEVECPAGHEHADWVTLDLLVNFSVDELFNLLFSDNAFFRSFLDSQGTTDIELGQWSEEPDADGVRHRNNTFTIAVNASFGPKSTSSTEKQKMQKESKPGSFYCIDCESFTDPSLPYGENFYVWNRYCISRVTKSTCRVTARTKICYVKSVFSLVKTIIEKNVRNGINSYFKPLVETLGRESDKMATTIDQRRKKKRYTKHRVASAHNRVASRPSNGAISGVKATQGATQLSELNSSRKASYISSTVRVMSALLIFLVMFNLLLFFKLWSLETRHAAMQYDSASSGLYSHQDLLDLLNKQKFLYDKDMNHWKATLESSTQLIEQLQQSIEEIKAQQAASSPHVSADSPGARPIATEVRNEL